MNNAVRMMNHIMDVVGLVVRNTPSTARGAIWKHVYVPLANEAYIKKLKGMRTRERNRLCETDMNSIAYRFCQFKKYQDAKHKRNLHRGVMESVVQESERTGVPQHVILARLDRFGVTKMSNCGKWFNDSYPLFNHPFINKWACRRFLARLWRPVAKWIEDHIDQFQYDHFVEGHFMRKMDNDFPKAAKRANRWASLRYYRAKRLDLEAFHEAWAKWNKTH